MGTVALVVNVAKEGVADVARRTGHILTDAGWRICCEPAEAAAIGQPDWACPDVDARDVDAAVVFGGDGTLLMAAKRFAAHDVPVLGVNLGHLGFLSELEPGEIHELPRLLSGEADRDTRMMLEAVVMRHGREMTRLGALNDIVVAKGPPARVVALEALADGAVIGTYRADGLIVATPTGSTAYSLSAGGPIVHPNEDVLVLTPICPHTLAARAMVLPAATPVSVRVADGNRGKVIVTADGQEWVSLEVGDEVLVSQADVRVTLLRRPGFQFYRVLRNKLAEQEKL